MGQINTDFPALPDTNDPQWPETYRQVYAQLEAMSLPTPGPRYNQITRAQLLKHLQQQAGNLLKAELQRTDDPDYRGKTDLECAQTVNNYHSPNDWHKSTVPAHRVLQGLPFAPNSLTEDDVRESKKNGD